MNINEQSKTLRLWDYKVVTSFIIALFFIVIGFIKIVMFPDFDEYPNAGNIFFEGDFDHYIINANFGTADFILALIFVVLGCTFLICNHLLLIYKK